MAEAGVPAGQQAAKLIEIAERFKALRQAAQIWWSGDPEIIELQKQIQDAVKAGDIARSSALVRTLEATQWKRIEEMAKHIELMPEEEREKLRKSIR
jgi:hypothetical protein